ncbi:tetratricopeptide repeat protein [Bacillus sp. ISL-35]|uniref:tetratricopeptide repeat protein n=1 Tax=Bacillus sp. ISL-35 TaxID=2819122 RepID=UPI001BED1C7E|nr:tetratricopeptide repeat protein [Bacillus sp. ISL-35]MBT2677806.1 tetratricopeptide repeat protein [Bacillus sp. ISL-35]MBT2705057.1 tetratricopeptide repeat protein [Chryseobacterium sp. ISL-80]
MIKPKRSLRQMKETASRQFTDREEPKLSFRKAMKSLSHQEYKVLVFYGVGGIGKTRLLKELMGLTDSIDGNSIKISIDFREVKHREPSEALIWFRQQLANENGIKFTTFDLAYAVYWRRMRPQQSLKADRKTIPFLEEGNFVGELITQLENIPVVQWIPKTIKLIDGFAQYKEILQWWTRTGKDILTDLKDMHPKDIEEMLLVYWASDLIDWIKRTGKNVIFFYDTYEALWESERTIGSIGDKDEWIREFILQFEDVPVLNVICGREKITWDKLNPEWECVVEQHLMGELSPTDCKSFLNSCGITDEGIQEKIIQGSEGLPYYLDLMVDTYQLVSRNSIPHVNDFSRRPDEVLQRFLKYLDRSEKETLKVLSIPRYWTEELFCQLVNEFNTFYPTTAYQQLCDFSFISESEQRGYWSMHKLMKEGLCDQVQSESQSLFERVHSFLFQYYTSMLNREIDDVRLSFAFAEGLYHGKYILEDEELFGWIRKHTTLLIHEGEWSCIIQEFTSLLEGRSLNRKLTALLNQKLGELFTLKGQYEAAVDHSNQALVGYYEELRDENNGDLCGIYRSIADIKHNLADLYRNTNRYELAIRNYKEAAAILEQKFQEADHSEEISLIYTRMGKLFKLLSQYDQAKQAYELALEKCLKLIDSGHATSTLYAVIGQIHEKLGEIEHDETQLVNEDFSHFHESIKAYERALKDNDNELDLRVIANQGLAYKRLAEALPVDTRAEEKLANFTTAIKIYKKVVKNVPDYIDVHEMLGHASVDLLDLYIDLGMYDKATESFNLAISSFDKVLELTEKQGSSRNRISSAYRTLGRMHRKQKNYKLALEAYQTALEKSNDVLIHTPDYIYGFNSRGKIFAEMGDFFIETGDHEQAVESYQNAITSFMSSLKKSPHSKTALSQIEKLNKTLKEILQN